MFKKVGVALFSAAVLASSVSYAGAQTAAQKGLHATSSAKVALAPTECEVTNTGMKCKVY